MKKFRLHAAGAVILITTTLIIYLTPNPLLKNICPNQYVLNCLFKTAKILNAEYWEGRETNDKLPSNLLFSLEDDSNGKILEVNAYSDNSKFFLSIPEIFKDGKYYGFFKYKNNFKRYFTYKKIYKNCFKIDSTGNKYFGLSNPSLTLEKTSQFTLNFNKKGIQNLSEAFLKKVIPVELPDEYREKIRNIIESIDSNTEIKLHIDNKNRLVGAEIKTQKDNNEIFAEVVFKNEKTLLNDIELMYYKKSHINSLIVNIKSSGNHKLVNGKFDDNTTISVVQNYVQLVKQQFFTSIEPECFSVSSEGKAMTLPVNLEANGNKDVNWSLSVTDKTGKVYTHNFNTKFSKEILTEVPNEELNSIFGLNDIKNQITEIFNTCIIQDILNILWKE